MMVCKPLSLLKPPTARGAVVVPVKEVRKCDPPALRSRAALV